MNDFDLFHTAHLRIIENQERMMADLAALQTAVAGIGTEVTNLSAGITAAVAELGKAVTAIQAGANIPDTVITDLTTAQTSLTTAQTDLKTAVDALTAALPPSA